MFRFTIRDVLWLTIVVGLSISWWIDNQRIEKSVSALATERRLLQEDFDDRLKVLDDTQRQASSGLQRVMRNYP